MLKIKLADESGEYVYMDICGSAFAYSFIDTESILAWVIAYKYYTLDHLFKCELYHLHRLHYCPGYAKIFFQFLHGFFPTDVL